MSRIIGSQMANDGHCRIYDIHEDGRSVERTSVTHHHVPSIAEQMGTDPQSKLAAAINRLCDLIEGKQ